MNAPATVSCPSRHGVHPALPQSEETRIHTRLERLALGIQESRAYWSHVEVSDAPLVRARRAFEERWFGAKSLSRIRLLLTYLAARYDAFPNALRALQRWKSLEPDARRVICHWHLQLSDPIYRGFTGHFLPTRRTATTATLDRPAALRWMRTQYADRWSESTLVQFASKLLSACTDAGLVSPSPDPRVLLVPRVPGDALVYLLFLLREIRFDGSLVDNPYLRSLGITDSVLDHHLRGAASVALRRAGNLWEFDWHHENLLRWSETLP